MIYPFFLVHMLAFGGSGFYMAYGADGEAPLALLYGFGGFSILIYLAFYVAMFGRDEVKWVFINAALGLFGIIAEIDWILSIFDSSVSDYPFTRHVIPFLYYVLYTFLLRQAVIDITRSRENPSRRRIIERAYIALSLTIYAVVYLL